MMAARIPWMDFIREMVVVVVVVLEEENMCS
jgi:hypothetical protein